MINILLIENNNDDVFIIKQALSRSPENAKKVNLDQADRLEKGISKIKKGKKKVDIIILNLDLPGCSGLETLNRLYEEVKDIPAVVLTGNGNEKMAEEAIKMGAQDYLLKENIIPDTLRRVIIICH